MSENQYSGLSNQQANSKAFLPFLLFLAIAIGVVIGYFINQITEDRQSVTFNYAQNSKIDDILSLIEAKYVDTVSTDKITEDAINQLLTELDPHSMYIPPKELTEVNEELEGNFDGIGIEFHIMNDTILVVSAISGGPSEGMGIRSGDKIITINDSTVAGVKITNEQVLKKLRGKKGTSVNVGIKRNGLKDLIPFRIVRDKIPMYSIDAAYLLNPKTAYIKINRFSATTMQEFKERLRPLSEKGATHLVLDLRGNGGGFLQAATQMLDEMIPGKSLLVYTEGKAYERQNYNATKPGMFEDGYIAVLVDQGSASASEIVAGAIQDLDRGWVIGRTTFGKGLVGEQYDLKDGSALRLTVGRYYTPSGRCIQKPYSKNTEAYYSEIYERYLSGKLVKEDTLSSDSLVYKTKKGRKVFGGGGIRPDVFIPLDTSLFTTNLLKIRSEVPEFVYQYLGTQSNLNKGYNDFYSFAKNWNIPSEMKASFISLLNAKKLPLSMLSAKGEAEIWNIMKAYVARQYWKMDGFYFVLNMNDVEIKSAIDNIEKPLVIN